MRSYKWLLVLVSIILTCSVRSLADQPKDVKFACSHHGPSNMQLTLSLEEGPSRAIEIVGKNSNGSKWFVSIDGHAADNGNGGKNKDSIKVHHGDTIIWKIESGDTGIEHGVAFAEKETAQAMLQFDEKTSKLLEDLNDFLSTDPWKAFGMSRWGTKPFAAGADAIVLVSAKVK
jgi:hypothetical protein